MNLWEQKYAEMLRQSQTQSRDILQEQINEIEELIKDEISKQENEPLHNPFSSHENLYKCSNGTNPSTMSKSEYLEAFAKGPCSPVIIIPGVGGSKLLVAINCESLRLSDPQLFQSCGWDSCQLGAKQAPKSEYKIWIPEVESAMSFLRPFYQNKNCFSGIFGFNLKIDHNGKVTVSQHPGVKVSTYGSTASTRKSSECGYESIQNLLPIGVQPAKYRYFQTMKEALGNAGYVTGLTMQPLPYDWREGYHMSSFHKKFIRIITEMVEIFGKEITVVAHSMGNLYAMDSYWKMPDKVKRLVARHIALAPPFLGAPRAYMHPLGLDDALAANLQFFAVGVTPEIFKQTISTFPSDYELMVTKFFRYHQKKEWMEAIKTRIEEENTFSDKGATNGTIMDIFPDWTSNCVTGISGKNSRCETGLFDLWESGTVAGFELNPDTAYELFQVYSYSTFAPGLFTYAMENNNFHEMPNPGVQMNIVYSNFLDTISKIHYNNNPLPKTRRNILYKPDVVETRFGDGTVLTVSAIAPGIKWAWEFEQKIEGAKPVKFVEICSHHNQKSTLLDDETPKNEYMGLQCSCEGISIVSKSGEECAHQEMVTELHLIDLIVNSLFYNHTGFVGARFKEMDEDKLNDYINNCNLFYLS